MIPATSFRGQRVALFGLGGSGVATALALEAGGAELVAFDDNPDKVRAAAESGIATGDLRKTGIGRATVLVLAPGVPLTHPEPHWSVKLANEAGVPVIGDIEIFERERRATRFRCPLVAITGTNGKSTTTALAAHVLRAAGLDVQMGGNIGTAVLSLEPFVSGRIYVVECSSYQIELAPSIHPTVGVLLNLAPDHLDRHGTMDNYATIKERLVAQSEFAVVGTDDSYSAAIASFHAAKGREIMRTATTGRLDHGLYHDSGHLVRASGNALTTVFDMSRAPALRGIHNAQNAAAAWAACRRLGLEDSEIATGMATFPGLAHRMEPVARIGGVQFVNDSKATNADAAARALASFDTIYWIAGGLAKSGGIEPLREYFPKIAKAYLIGEAAPEFAATLGATPFEIAGTIEVAVARASRDAAADGRTDAVVLLSPACASFDQFANFEKRGDAFRAAVLALAPAGSMTEASS